MKSHAHKRHQFLVSMMHCFDKVDELPDVHTTL